ncbi:MAG: YeeE/YedE family protein [Bacteriovoracaceae bacterium]|nr:YeeE/YedE family protein [Bacteriovoracaceae bacterium]
MNDYYETIQMLGKAAWSPYLAGALIGILAWLTFTFSNKPIGASSAYATVAGLLGKLIAKKHTLKLKYYKENPPEVSWGLVFVLSAIGGSFISSITGGEFEVRWVPKLWEEVHGSSSYSITAFIGGIFMAFGARLAGGCTSGHGISGTLQLSLASWVSLLCFFIGGIIGAQFLY